MSIDTIISLISLAVAVLVFVYTELENKKATQEQTRVQNVRATLTDFSNLRHHYQSEMAELDSKSAEEQYLTVRDYLRELERFAVGCNMDAYDLSVVSNMSGGTLVNHYRKYFRKFIENARRNLSLTSAIKPEALYAEFETMMKKLFELRGETFIPVGMMDEDERVLERFLDISVSSPDRIFEVFRSLDGAVERKGEGRQRYLYVPGTRKDRCLLLAHADTYFDTAYGYAPMDHGVIREDGMYKGNSSICSIGADDRCGCAMLWLLRKSGHSLLILDGEEHGQIGANFLKDTDPGLMDEINGHAFMLQLDRRNSSDYRVYDLPVSAEFKKYIETETSFVLAEGKGRTDIIPLCRDICAVNLSVGYYNEHTPDEYVVIDEWKHTLELVRKMLAKDLKRYPVKQPET